MALDRWIALVILILCLVYGYAAFFTMDDALPPFMRRTPVWPSTFPKVLAVLASLAALTILLGLEGRTEAPKPGEIDHRRLAQYKLGQALAILALMVAYALLLRPAGFLASTVGFLVVSSAVLGERRWHILLPVALIAAGGVWYLVQQVLGIFLSPWPAAFS